MTFASIVGSNLLASWSAKSGLFSDTGATTASTDGGAVAAWVPEAGSIAPNATQSTAGRQPTYDEDTGSGYPGVVFSSSGTADQLLFAHSTSWHIDEMTIFAVITTTTQTTNQVLWTKANTSWTQGPMLITNGTTGRYVSSISHYQKSVDVVEVPTGTKAFALRGRVATDDIVMSGDRASAVSSNTAQGAIGNDPSGNYGWNGTLHQIAIVEEWLQESVMHDALDQLATDWGLTWTRPDSGGGGIYNPFRNPRFGGA